MSKIFEYAVIYHPVATKDQNERGETECSMKFKVHMKDPDTLSDAVNDAAKAEVAKLADVAEDEREMLAETRARKVYEDCCDKWFEYGEYLVVEIDTDAGTCVVVPN